MSKLLNNIVYRIVLKLGLKANINSVRTKGLAKKSELHFTSDTNELFINNGTENVQIPTLPSADDVPFTGTYTTGDTIVVKNGIIVVP